MLEACESSMRETASEGLMVTTALIVLVTVIAESVTAVTELWQHFQKHHMRQDIYQQRLLLTAPTTTTTTHTRTQTHTHARKSCVHVLHGHHSQAITRLAMMRPDALWWIIWLRLHRPVSLQHVRMCVRCWNAKKGIIDMNVPLLAFAFLM